MRVLYLANFFANYVHYPILKMEKEFKLKHFTFFFRVLLPFRNRRTNQAWSRDKHTCILKQENYQLVNIYRFPRSLFESIYATYMYLMIVRQVQKDDYTLIHANNIEPTGIVAYKLSRKLKIPYLITDHGSKYYFCPPTSRQKKKIIKKFDKILTTAKVVIAGSQGLQDFILSYWPSARVKIVYNTFNSEVFSFQPALCAAPYSLLSSSMEKNRDNHLPLINLLTVGSFDHNKNHFLILRAMLVLLKEYPTLRLTVIGDGSLKEDYLQFIRTNHLESCVIIKNFLPHHLLVTEYHQANLFILPSRKETFGIVLLEAMACGLPVLASNTDGPLSIIEHNVDGILFKNNDLIDLMTKIREVLDQPEKQRLIRTKAFLKVKKYLYTYRELYALYEKIAAKNLTIDSQ